MWLGGGCLTISCRGTPSVWLVRRVEVGGCMDNQHAQAVEEPDTSGGALYQPWCARQGWGLCCEAVFSFPVWCTATSTYQNHKTQNCQHLKNTITSPHAYSIIPGYGKILKFIICICNFLLFSFALFVCHNFCLS